MRGFSAASVCLIIVLAAAAMFSGCVSDMDEPLIIVQEKDSVEYLAAEPFDHAGSELLNVVFETGSQVTAACIGCHEGEANDFMKTVHWTWEGEAPYVANQAADTVVGKMTTINNFCVAVSSNEGRCTHCHAKIGATI